MGTLHGIEAKKTRLDAIDRALRLADVSNRELDTAQLIASASKIEKYLNEGEGANV